MNPLIDKIVYAALSVVALSVCGCGTMTQLPTAEFTLRVTEFRDVQRERGDVTPYAMSGPELPEAKMVFLRTGSFQKTPGIMSTIRVDGPGAILRLKIAGREGATYRPIGIAFQRADGTTPSAVLFSTDSKAAVDSPFSALEIRGDTLQIRDVPVSRKLIGLPEGDTHVTYRFSVIIQDAKTGAIGIIDPEIENETPN